MGRIVGKTVMLRDIKDFRGQTVTDHLWFHLGKGFEKLDLKVGDTVQFEGRVSTYRKHRGEDTDYKIGFLKNLRKVETETLREKGQGGLI